MARLAANSASTSPSAIKASILAFSFPYLSGCASPTSDSGLVLVTSISTSGSEVAVGASSAAAVESVASSGASVDSSGFAVPDLLLVHLSLTA